MSIPKEPRQLMINLMYLVLTAMLALNISSEILNAFKTINDSITKSNTSIDANNATLYSSMQIASETADTKARVLPFYEKAKIVKTKADSMYNYLDTLKAHLIKDADGIVKETGHINKEGDIDIATRMFVEGDDKSKAGGDDLKKRLTAFRNFLLAQPDNQPGIDKLNKQMPLVAPADLPKTENNPRGDWATGNFFHMPVVAAVTLFTKYQNDLRNSEALVVQELMNEASAKVITFDAIQAIAVPKTTYAKQGDKIEAQIMLAAYNRTLQPTVSPSTGHITKVQDGVAYWENTASGTGETPVHGTLNVMFNGEMKSLPWDFKYTVGSVGASMQLDKMQVFYIGVPNPVSISAAGYNMEDVKPVFDGGGASFAQNAGGKGHYDVTVTAPGELTASVVPTTGPQSGHAIMSEKIKVKYLPDPTAKIGGKIGGLYSASSFKVQSGIEAAIPPDFIFQASYRVTKFTISYKPKGQEISPPFEVSGAYFRGNSQVANMISNARIGDKIYIDNVHAVGPDGKDRSINPLIFTLN